MTSEKLQWYLLYKAVERIKKDNVGIPVVAHWVTNPTSTHEDVGSIPGLTQWVKDLLLHKLWCSSQTRLRSAVVVAVAVAGSCSSNLTPGLGTSICYGCGSKKKKRYYARKCFMNARMLDTYKSLPCLCKRDLILTEQRHRIFIYGP